MHTSWSFQGREDVAHRRTQEERRVFGEYVSAAMKDLHRYREALLTIEQSRYADPRVKAEARKALRNYKGMI